jgi:hypothetical protein
LGFSKGLIEDMKIELEDVVRDILRQAIPSGVVIWPDELGSREEIELPEPRSLARAVTHAVRAAYEMTFLREPAKAKTHRINFSRDPDLEGDFFPPEAVQQMADLGEVPLRYNFQGPAIGTAKIHPDGTIEATVDRDVAKRLRIAK